MGDDVVTRCLEVFVSHKVISSGKDKGKIGKERQLARLAYTDNKGKALTQPRQLDSKIPALTHYIIMLLRVLIVSHLGLRK